MLLLTLEPRAGLAAVTAKVAAALAARLAILNSRDIPVFVRFGHEMNGSWYPWAQQPPAYVAAFRRVAEAVHRQAALAAAMVWAPNYGGGYPFAAGRYLETAAFYAPANGGAPAQAIKQAWRRQVLAPDLTRNFPRLRMVNWFEWRKYEPEVHAVVDWTVTRDPAQRTVFRAHLPDWLRYANAVDFCRR